MANQTEICNDALTLLGAGTINAITDQSNQAYALNAVWNLERRSELRVNIWKFAITRQNVPLLTSTPPNGPYSQVYAYPTNCLRIMQVGNTGMDYPGVDLSDFRSGPTLDDYAIEGNTILSNIAAPLAVRYVQDVTDPTQWDTSFCGAFAARLALRTCFRITQSHQGEQVAMARYKKDLLDAVKANALETPPTMAGDDSWIATRPVGSGGAPWIRYG